MRNKLVAATVVCALCLGGAANVTATAQSSTPSDSRRIGPIIAITAGTLAIAGSSLAAGAALSSQGGVEPPQLPPRQPSPAPEEVPEPVPADAPQPAQSVEEPADAPVPVPAPAEAPAPATEAPRQEIASVKSGATELKPGVARYI